MYHGVTHNPSQDDPTEDATPDAPPDAAPDSSPDASPDAPPDAESEPEAKKERVLHTRIPVVLEQELKALAQSLRVPVSNLVRTILEDAVTIADRASVKLESRLERAAQSVHSEREKLRARVPELDPLADVIAFQPVMVAARASCVRCGEDLESGADAALGVSTRPTAKKIFVCKPCLPAAAKSVAARTEDD